MFLIKITSSADKTNKRRGSGVCVHYVIHIHNVIHKQPLKDLVIWFNLTGFI